MRINFRSIVLAPAVLAVASFAAVSAHAETTLKVPFAFKAAGKICPAGEYVMSEDTKSSIVTLRSKDSSRSFSWAAGPGAVKAGKATLRFDVSDSGYELRTAQYGLVTTSRLDGGKRSERMPAESVVGQ